MSRWRRMSASRGSCMAWYFPAMSYKLVGLVAFALLGAMPGCRRVSQIADKASDVTKPSTTTTPIVSGSAMGPAKPRGPVKEATGHPRLFVREQDVQRLRGWATAQNPLFANGLKPLIDQCVQNMDKGLLKDDPGSAGGYTEHSTEAFAMLFAFWSLIAPSQGERDSFAKRSHKLLMSAIDKAVKGVKDDQPFRASDFAINNRARWTGEAFPLTVDWIYGTLSAEDKKKIR